MTTRTAAAALLLAIGLAAPAAAETVVEFINVDTGRYHLTALADEIAVLDGGGAGAGWTRTGQRFDASGTEPVLRFVRDINGVSEHFFTSDAREGASLQQPGTGWSLEGTAFRTISYNPSSGCPRRFTGGFSGFFVDTYPVFRVFAGALGFGHRYTASASERAALLARGWIDEGVAFCATGYSSGLLRAFSSDSSTEPVGSSAFCRDESRPRLCLAVFNLPLPTHLLGPVDPASVFTLAGVQVSQVFASTSSTPPTPANPVGPPVFVARSAIYGLFLDSSARGDSPYASLALHHQLTTSRGALDERFRPWRLALPETELVLRFSLGVVKLDAEAGSHAYGHSTIEFLDQRSDRSFYFNVLAYSSSPLGGDGVGFDVNENKPIVAARYRAPSSFMRVSGTDPREFTFHVDRSEFQRIVGAARRLDPALSDDPADYVVANFRVKNETVGNGLIGVGMTRPALYHVIRGTVL